jgi:hypothetical protein
MRERCDTFRVGLRERTVDSLPAGAPVTASTVIMMEEWSMLDEETT